MRREEIVALAAALAAGCRLTPSGAPSGGSAGGFAGRLDGQSVDFHDYRQYQPGDDLRRVDWRAYARSGQMHMKLFREEVSPMVEVHLDTSPGMDVYEGKAHTLIFLAAFIHEVARSSEARPVLCRDGKRHTGGDFLPALLDTRFDAKTRPFANMPPARGASRPIRYFLSDYLFGDELAATFSRHAAGGLAFTPLMILAESEINPPWRGHCRLIDAADERRFRDVSVGDGAIAEYRRRLALHQESLARLARRNGGRLIVVETPDGGGDAERWRALAGRMERERLVRPC